MNNSASARKSRRWFLGLGFLHKNAAANADRESKEKVSLLTADGKLVEVDREIAENARLVSPAGNREIMDWMDNPSKK